ncbi:hypothetical protein ACIQCG_01150 [Streptomyces noursei]|uniref:hypothetical protein n=1 Tax=Streptomyces noursei TaxID=1971 RepID=UPI0037FBA198
MTEPTQEQLTARAEADIARFEEALPTSREIGTTGELAALAATLPADTPLFVEQHLRADQALHPDPVEVAVAHIAGARVRLAPDRPDSPSRTLPGLGPTTVRVDRSQDAGTEFDRGDMEPLDLLARAELRLMTDGNVEDRITDVADVIAMLARLLEKGAGFIDRDHDTHATLQVEMSRLLHAAERLRNIAPSPSRPASNRTEGEPDDVRDRSRRRLVVDLGRNPMFGQKKSDEAVLAALRESALRSIWRQHQENGPGDVNPHTAQLTTSALASMLTFSADGSSVHVNGVIDRVAHMICAGKRESQDARVAWTVWELERLGKPDAATQLTELVQTHGDMRTI